MNPFNPLHEQTRRHFFGQCGLSLGSLALASLLESPAVRAESRLIQTANPLASHAPHFPARAKRVIYLFMGGGPSQLELFDYKPKLQELNGQQIPESYLAGRRFAFLNAKAAPLLGTVRTFRKHGQSGAELSDTLPHLATVADDIAIVRSMKTDVFNHGPAKVFMNTGASRPGRPSMGAWVTYGIGSESQDLPAFVVLQSGSRGPRGGTALWSSGFLPTTHQGTTLRSAGEPILDLTSPAGISRDRQRQAITAINALNAERLGATGDGEIATRISAYEMAFRMQASAPELIDFTGETPATLELYGVEANKPSFARNCLLARRLIERGTRFVQLYHTDWDNHGGAPQNSLTDGLAARCKEIDQASAALIKDLKSRGLLDDTLVIWGGEFGRTPMAEDRQPLGRDHHTDAFTMWLAGGGIKPGQTIGQTDEIGFSIVEDEVHVHDLHATILHLLGLDHLKLVHRFQGRDFRLTDVGGKVVQKLLA